MLAAVSAITAEAGALALARWQDDFGRWEKSPGQMVSDVDLEVDALLRERLMALDPTAGWLSEETADNTDRLACARLWVVDPIDGTRDYLRKRPGWAVSVALIEHGVPIIGVLDAPARGEHWRAAAGSGAYRGDTPMKVGLRTDFAGSRVPADNLPKTDSALVMVAKPNSIALRIAMVAADEADLVATLRWGYEWDIAAAALIAAEAGAMVSDAFGHPLAFNTPSAQAFGVLASVPGIHAAAVDKLAERANALVGAGKA
ncbi:MAG: 3'(2'),5'-bisphosphate nucleotidase CysQ [Sphingomonas sp.]